MTSTTKTIADMRIIEHGSLPGHIATGHPDRHDLSTLDLVKIYEGAPGLFKWNRDTFDERTVLLSCGFTSREDAEVGALQYNRPPYILFHEYDGVAAALEG